MSYRIAKFKLLFYFILMININLAAQERAVGLSIESFYSDEGPMASREYNPLNFDDVFPGDPNGYLARGIAKLDDEFYSESLIDFDAAIELAPDCGVCYYYRGLNYLALDDMLKAKNDLQKAIYHDVLLIEAYNDLSNIYIYENELDSAKYILNKGIGRYPSYLPTYFNLGVIELLKGKKSRALKQFEKCLEMDSCHVESHSMVASIFIYDNRMKKAEPVIDKMVDCNPDNSETYLWKAMLKHSQNKLKESMVELNKAIEAEESYIYYYLRGFFYIEDNLYDLAIKDFAKSYELNPLEVENYQGSFMYRETQIQYQRIIGYYLTLNDDFTGGEMLLLDKAICMLMVDQYSRAAEELKNVLEFNSKNHLAYLLLGVAQENLRLYQSAFENYNKSISLNGNFDEAYKRRGVLLQADDDFNGAIDDFNKMYEVNPYSSEALKYRGIAKVLKGEYELALIDFEECESKFEDDADVFFNKGQCQGQLGLYEGAISSFKKVLKYNPDDIESMYEIAENYYGLSDADNCLKMCDSILSLKDCFMAALNLKGVLQMDRLNYGEALLNFDRAISCSPLYVDAYINKSLVFIKTGKNNEAFYEINQAIEFNPNNGFSYLIRAQIKHNLGIGNACRDLDTAISLGMDVSKENRSAICN